MSNGGTGIVFLKIYPKIAGNINHGQSINLIELGINKSLRLFPLPAPVGHACFLHHR